MTSPRHVRDVRDPVRDLVRPETLLAVGLCGMCGRFAAFAGAGEKVVGVTAHVLPPSRAYECPHIPHVPHIPCDAGVWGDSAPAQPPAQPAHVRARAKLSLPLVSKGMDMEGGW